MKTLIKHKACVIRSASHEDAQILCKWWNDGAIMAHAGFPNGLGTSVEAIQSSISKDSKTHQRLLISLEEDLIGEMSYRGLNELDVEIGIKICEVTHQNKGIGTTFLKMLITHLFDALDYKRVVLDTDLSNKRAQHVYEKLGFCKIRINKDNHTDQLGNKRSSVDYQLEKENRNWTL